MDSGFWIQFLVCFLAVPKVGGCDDEIVDLLED